MFHVKHNAVEVASMNPHEGEAPDESELASSLQDRLAAFTELVTRWNPIIKLVSNNDIPNLWSRHVADALQLVPYLPVNAASAVDLGSGAGFPGIVLALATGVHFDLLESDSRKAAFLREVVRVTNAPATVHASRIEDSSLGSVALVTARALAPLPRLLDLAHPFLADDGICLFPKSERATVELEEARASWVMDVQHIPSRTSTSGQILRIANLRRRDMLVS